MAPHGKPEQLLVGKQTPEAGPHTRMEKRLLHEPESQHMFSKYQAGGFDFESVSVSWEKGLP
jgi:hypothetical protein